MALMAGDNDGVEVVGTRPVRPDGVDKVTGRARFGADFAHARHAGRPGAAQPPRPRAHQAIDTSKARALPGVKAVVTGDDFPTCRRPSRCRRAR